jgi:hypothetical protein
MPNQPEQREPATRGTVYVVRQSSSPQAPSEFLVSFGDRKDGVGAFDISRASGLDALAAFLLRSVCHQLTWTSRFRHSRRSPIIRSRT